MNEATMITEFFNQDILPHAMMAFAAGLVSIIIAVAIFVTDRNSERDFDKVVILEKVIGGKWIFVWLLLLFLPLFLWETKSLMGIRYLFFIFYLIGVYKFVHLLLRVYKWIIDFGGNTFIPSFSYRQQERTKYLASNLLGKENALVWHSVWNTKNMSFFEVQSYANAFHQSFSNMRSNGEDNTDLINALTSISTNIDKIHLSPWILEPLLKSGVESYHYAFVQDTRTNNRGYLIHTSKTLVVDLISKGLKDDPHSADAVIDILKAEIMVMNNNRDYTLEIVQAFAEALFESTLEYPECAGIWKEVFPDEWKVTLENLSDPDNLFAKVWVEEFFQWLSKKMYLFSPDQGDSLDRDLMRIVEGLFPDVDMLSWSMVLEFIFRNGDLEDLVLSPYIFGIRTRVHMVELTEEGQTEYQQLRSKEKEETLNLALEIFKSILTSEYLDDCLDELNNLQFDDTSTEARRRDRFKGILMLLKDKLLDTAKDGTQP